MLIKKITLALLAAAIAVMAVLALWRYQVGIEPMLRDTAADSAAADAKAVLALLVGQQKSLVRLAADLVSGDEGSMERYGEADFYVNTGIQAFYRLDNLGQTLFSRWYEPRTGRFEDAPAAVNRVIDAGSLRSGPMALEKYGRVVVDGRVLQLASRAAAGTHRGMVVVGQFVDDYLAGVADPSLRLEFTVLPFDSPELPAELRDRRYDFARRDHEIVHYGAEGVTRAALVLGDFDNRPILAVLVAPGFGGADPIQASWRFQTFLILAAVGLGFLLYLYLDFAVFRPVSRMQGAIDRIVARDHEAGKGEDYGLFDGMAKSITALADDMRANDTALRDHQASLSHRSRVEDALAKVTRNLLRNPAKGIANSLRILGSNLDTDVVSYWQLDKDGDAMRCMGTFRNPETGEFSGEYDFSAPAAEWIGEAINYDRHIIINDVKDIPPEMDSVRAFISEYDLKSFQGVPLRVPGTRLGGLVAFGDIRGVRTWSGEDLRALEMVAELFVDHIGRTMKEG